MTQNGSFEDFDVSVAILFKGFISDDNESEKTKTVDVLCEKALRKGIYIPETILSKMPIGVYNRILDVFGYDIVNINQGAFHKSFGEVKNSSEEKLFIQQILHYMSVFMQSGNEFSSEEVDSSIVYIPRKELNLPEGDSIRLTVIRKMTEEEVISHTKAMLSSGMALKDDTQNYLLSIINKYKNIFSLKDVKNKELRIRLIDCLHIMPRNTGEFLRYLVYKKTGSSMVFHTNDTIQKIIYSPWNSEQAFISFVEKNGVEAIAREFNRHKKLWLSFKKDGKFVAKTINRARKLSSYMNRPYKIPALDRIGSEDISLDEIKKELKNVSLFKKVSVANSLLRRFDNPSANMFIIRNGSSFVQEAKQTVFETRKRKEILHTITQSIVEDVRPCVEGKKIFLPENMDYAFPISEKMFVGNIPFYSTMKLPQNVVLGIHWFNLLAPWRERVDLDLHYVSQSGRHIGWYDYMTSKDSIIHSGDMTDAPYPRGASEAVYVPEEVDSDFAVIYLNCYTSNSVEVPYSLFVGEADRDQLSKEYLISAHNTMLNINGLSISGMEDTIGFLESREDGKLLHFINTTTGKRCVSGFSNNTKMMMDAIKSSLKTRVSLYDVLLQAGAVFEKEEDEEWDFDLSFEKLTTDSFSFLFNIG